MDNAFDVPGTLMVKCHELLKRDDRDLLTIHKETGIPFYWLREFVAYRIKNPSVNRIQFLVEKLTNKQLEV